MKFLLIFVGCLAYQTWADPDQNTLGRACFQPSDCSASECCVLPTSRFVNGTCQLQRVRGEQCRPGQQPQDLSYPVRPDTNERVQVQGGYSNLCPCTQELTCDGGTCA